MKVTVCELPDNWTDTPFRDALVRHLTANKSDFLLLPEMGFSTWLSKSGEPDPAAWQSAVRVHDEWMERLEEFQVPMVAGTRPVIKEGKPLNTAFVWTRETGVRLAHEKYYLPDEEGFWEATWYRRGDGGFDLVEIDGIRMGFLICSELWFTHHARAYAKAGIHLLLCPRATPMTSTPTWVACGQTNAWISGGFCLSSNFSGPITADMEFGGTGWITEPDGAKILSLTNAATPFVTREIDIRAADAAKETYPRYIRE